jgi:hypothetical protein
MQNNMSHNHIQDNQCLMLFVIGIHNFLIQICELEFGYHLY